MQSITAVTQTAPIVFAIVLAVAAFYSIGRVVNARQPIALAFALVPMLLLWTAQQSLV